MEEKKVIEFPFMEEEVAPRYITVTGGAEVTRQAFTLINKDISRTTLERVTPRVDTAKKRYYWLMYLIGKDRLALKMYCNGQTEEYLLAYLRGMETPSIDGMDLSPADDVEDMDEWLLDHQSQTKLHATRHTEEVSLSDDGKMYHTHIYHFPKGKIVYPGNVIENIADIM